MRARGEELWVRLFFCFTDDRALVLLSAIYKKQNSLTPSEVQQAENQLKDFRKAGKSVVYWQSKRD